MKKIIFCALVIWPMMTFAQAVEDWVISVPNTPANGDVADVTKLNANFDYLEDILSFKRASGYNFIIGGTNEPTIFFDEDNNSENPTGIANLGVGFEVLDKLRLGTGNVAYGFSTLNELDDCSYNTAVGIYALTEIEGSSCSWNTGVGFGAGRNLLTGTFNIALGVSALGNLTTGNSNIAIGKNSMLSSNAPASYSPAENISIGDDAMRNHTGGYRNVAIGSDALGGLDDREGRDIDVPTSGNYNVAVGPVPSYRTRGITTWQSARLPPQMPAITLRVGWRSALARKRGRTRSPLVLAPRLPVKTQWLWVPMPT